MISTIKGNYKGFTNKQVRNAKRAWRLYINTGGGGIEHFKHFLRQNIIEDNPVTNDDVNIAQKIFVKEVAGLKGQTTHRDPIPVTEDIIEIPLEITQQYNNLVLYMDIMFVNQMPMLTSIDDKIRNRSLVPLASREADDIYDALDVIM